VLGVVDTIQVINGSRIGSDVILPFFVWALSLMKPVYNKSTVFHLYILI